VLILIDILLVRVRDLDSDCVALDVSETLGDLEREWETLPVTDAVWESDGVSEPICVEPGEGETVDDDVTETDGVPLGLSETVEVTDEVTDRVGDGDTDSHGKIVKPGGEPDEKEPPPSCPVVPIPQQNTTPVTNTAHEKL
jgi:hypothetical protein